MSPFEASTRMPTQHTFCLFLGLIIVQGGAFLFDENGVVTPPDPYVFIGDVLNLTCKATDNTNHTGNVSESLFFTKMYGIEERPLPAEYMRILDPTSILLEYPVTSSEDMGGYTCLNGQSKLFGSQFVRVEHRPLDITEVNTVVDDWRSMIISWDLGQDYINPNLLRVELSWTVNPNQQEMYLCPHGTTTSCSWTENDGSDSFKMMHYYINISVVTLRSEKSSYETGRTDSVFTVDPSLFVKPAPVQDLTVVDRNSTCISLSWNHSQNSQLRTIRHTVLVSREFHLVQNISTRESDMTVCGLKPAEQYIFNISCIPERGGHYSEWRDTESATKEDVPSGAPKMASSSFRFHSCGDVMCNVSIYWQPVSEDERNGKITGYRLRLTEHPINQKNITSEVNVRGTERWYDFLVKKDRGYRAEVTAATAVGYSNKAAVINIPSQQNEPHHPNNLVVESNGNRLFVSWDPAPEVGLTGYTLHYCSGSTRTYKCADDIQWIHLPANQTYYVLDQLDGILDNNLIGISTDREVGNQYVTGGIHWNECIYMRDGKPARLENVAFPPGQLERALRIEWEKPGCTGKTPYIQYYVISYCRSSGSNCAGVSVEQNVSNKEQSHVIKDLEVGVTYGATVRAASRAGLGQESLRVFKEVVTIGLTPGQFAGIGIGGFFVFVLVLAIGVFIARRIHRKFKDIIIPIEVPRPPCSQFDEPADLPSGGSYLRSENNNDEKKPTSAPQNTAEEDNTESETGRTDSDGGHELSPDIPTTEHNTDSNSSSTNSSTSGSVSSTTPLISETRPKLKAPNLYVNLPSTGSSSTGNVSSGYKTLSEVMKTDSSQTESTDASYSRVTTGYLPSPVSSPGGYVSDSSQTQLIIESPSPTDDKLQQKYMSLPGIKEERLSQFSQYDKGTVQNSDYIMFGQGRLEDSSVATASVHNEQDTQEGSNTSVDSVHNGQDTLEDSGTAASYSKVVSGSDSFSEEHMSDSNQGETTEETTSSPAESKAVHQNYVTLPNYQEGKYPKELQYVQNNDYVRCDQGPVS